MSTDKIIEIVLNFLKEFGPALAADYFVHYFKGPTKIVTETLNKAASLQAAGKGDEAKKALEALPGGIGLADEMIFETDLLAIKRLRRVTDVQLIALLASMNSLTVPQKKRLRLAHVNQTNEQIRRENLVELAKLDNANRRAIWQATGLFEPGIEEQFDAAVLQVDIFLAQVQAEQGAEEALVRGLTPRQRFWRTIRRFITFSAVREAL